MRDLVTDATMAFTDGDAGDVAVARHSWYEVAASFWAGQSGADASGSCGKGNKQKTLCRAKVFEWLAATAMFLVVATGTGWQQFQQSLDPGARGDARLWKSLTLSIDQGSDGWSAAHFLLSIGIVLLLVPDQSHRVWNDVQLGLDDAGVWFWALCLIVILNVDSGPWKGMRWWHEMRYGCAALEQLGV